MIIGLGYRARSGKDTVAKILERFGYRTIAFAEPLKSAARELFGLSPAQLNGDRKEVLDDFWQLTPRNIMQRLGTEAMRREFGDDFWVRAAKRRMDSVDRNIGQRQRWVITDVRFINEALAVKSWGGRVIRVDRPGAGATGGVASHPSEVQLEQWEGWDGVLKNDGTLEELESRTLALHHLMGTMR